MARPRCYLRVAVSEVPTSWFHCARCGALFRAPVGRAPACTSCGENPSLGVAPAPVDPAPAAAPYASAAPPPQQEGGAGGPRRHRRHRDDDGSPPGDRRGSRRAKSGAPMLLLVVGWCVVMLAIVFAANHFWKPNDQASASRRPAHADDTLSPAENELLREQAATCQALLGQVLSNNTPESLSPFVFNRIDTLPDMARFYRLNSGTPSLETRVEASAMSVIRLPEGPAIEGRWTTEDGRVYDAVFRKQNDDWLVDWHHFVRYSDFPWPLFLSGDGPDVAEFRLLARQRLVRRGLDDDDMESLSVVFHPPQFGRPDEPGPASPVFEFERESAIARKLMAGFEQARSGDRPFRSLLPNIEPDDDMVRVRVVIRRIDGDGEEDRRFELLELRAFHWLQHDDPGILPDHSGAPEF